MPKLKIDGMEIEVAPGTSVLQACEMLGKEIPRFCYHDRLSVPANCRMCLVEQKGSPKPIASCALACAENMEIFTESEVTRKARKGVMEMLLINHPLDCPICDQGGECDLQDQAMAYGFDRGRYTEEKRAVKDKELGPLIKTVMTRCIHCTRCVRFSDEIAGNQEMGMTGRGEHSEIGPYIEKSITSELSGNMIDVCPVGALTSKPFAFQARSWELSKTESVDVLDAVGSNIRIDARGGEVLRVLPRLNEAVNEEWISDKTRFAYDGLTRRRLDRPWIRKSGKLEPASWDEALDVVAVRMGARKGSQLAAVAGDQCDAESMKALLDLMRGAGSPNTACRQYGARYGTSVRAGYLFNSGIAGIDKADVILLVGTNPRWEAPIINARIRKRYLAGGVRIAVIGERLELTYPYRYLGAGPRTLEEIVSGSHEFRKLLDEAKAPMVIMGQGCFARADGMAIHALGHKLADACLLREGWNGFNMLHTAAARVGALELGFVPGEGGLDIEGILSGAESGAVDFVWLLGADGLDMSRLSKAFVVYQGSHGDAGAAAADVVLPGAAYTEKHGLYVNTEGRVQQGRRAVFPPGEAREDWKIVRALSERLGKPLPYDSIGRLRAVLAKDRPHFGKLDTLPEADWAPFGAAGKTDAAPFVSPVTDFYRSCAVSRASETMKKCAEELLPRLQLDAGTGTHG
jgi:NADH-quinone oxidoreductase subunit G